MISGERALLPERIANLRDTAGLATETGRTVRHGRLLRSGTLAHHSTSTLARLTALTGPGSYIDLRTDREVDREGGLHRLGALGWRWSRYPIEDAAAPAPSRAPEAPTVTPAEVDVRPHLAVAAAVAEQLLADGDARPLIVACSLGKDRTGLVVASVLRWLGVSGREICRDYLLSNRCMQAQRNLLPSRWSEPEHPIGRVTARSCRAALARATPPPGTDLVRLRAAMLDDPAPRAAGHLVRRTG